jgi:SAM-dependent methyltransferase
MAGEEQGDGLVARDRDVDLDVVKAEIMAEVEALRKRRQGMAWMPESCPGTSPTQLSESVARILSLEDTAFVRAAYVVVLGRPVDSIGYVDVMDRLIEGESRRDVLWSLAESVEARSQGVEPTALLGERPVGASPARGRKQSLFRRCASWIVRLAHAPGRVTTTGRDLRRLSLRVDWLLSEVTALAAAKAEMASATDQSLRDFRDELLVAQTTALAAVRAETAGATDQSLRDLRDDLTVAQNTALEAVRAETAREVAELKTAERIAQLQQAWEAVSEGLQRQLDIAAEQCRRLVTASEASVSNVHDTNDRVRQLERRLLMNEYRLASADQRTLQGRADATATRESGLPSLADAAADVDSELLYLAIEDAFRGTDATILSRLEPYLGRVAECGAGTVDSPILDLGCGRGEWLQLLDEHGYKARGVDSSATMVGLCERKGYDVECADAVDYLSRLEPASTGMITAFHVIEHLPFGQLLQVVDLSLRALRPGGVLILETPNPENIVVATCNFYVDPTHIRPIPPDLLQFLVKARGFGDVEILRLHPLDMVRPGDENREWLNPVLDRFNCAQDYAVAAVKPMPAGSGQGHDENRGSTV